MSFSRADRNIICESHIEKCNGIDFNSQQISGYISATRHAFTQPIIIDPYQIEHKSQTILPLHTCVSSCLTPSHSHSHEKAKHVQTVNIQHIDHLTDTKENQAQQPQQHQQLHQETTSGSLSFSIPRGSKYHKKVINAIHMLCSINIIC